MYIIPRSNIYEGKDICSFAEKMDSDMNAYFEEKEKLLEIDGITNECKVAFIHPDLFLFYIIRTGENEWGIALTVNGSTSSNLILIKKGLETKEDAEKELVRIITTGQI